MPHALIVDDHSATLSSLAEVVEAEGFTVARARSLQDARQQLQTRPPEVILLDLHLPDGEGMSLLDDLDLATSPSVVLVTGQASVATAIEGLRRGVSDYLTKPIDVGRLRTILSDIARTRGLKQEIEALRSNLASQGSFGLLVGASPRMQEIYQQISLVAPTNATVLIVGESGTGKELVARTLHDLSRRRLGPFVALNCGAISPTLIESELFGHERGSFTGADRRHKGVFEQATRGTLFLDEVTEMPMDLQVKLLRVLESGSFMRTGGESPLAVDIRFIAATNRDPEEAIRQGRFATISTTASKCFSSRFRACGIGSTTSSCSPGASCSRFRRAKASRSDCPRRPRSCSVNTPGRGTCANSRTPCTAPTSWRRRI